MAKTYAADAEAEARNSSCGDDVLDSRRDSTTTGATACAKVALSSQLRKKGDHSGPSNDI